MSSKVWHLIVMYLVDHKPWRSTYCSIWSSPEKALEQLQSILESQQQFDEDDDPLTLDNYKEKLTDYIYFDIEECNIDPVYEEYNEDENND